MRSFPPPISNRGARAWLPKRTRVRPGKAACLTRPPGAGMVWRAYAVSACWSSRAPARARRNCPAVSVTALRRRAEDREAGACHKRREHACCRWCRVDRHACSAKVAVQQDLDDQPAEAVPDESRRRAESADEMAVVSGDVGHAETGDPRWVAAEFPDTAVQAGPAGGEHPVAAGPVPRDPLFPDQRGNPQAVDQHDRVGPVRVEVIRARRQRSLPAGLPRPHGHAHAGKLAGRAARLHLSGGQPDDRVQRAAAGRAAEFRLIRAACSWLREVMPSLGKIRCRW